MLRKLIVVGGLLPLFVVGCSDDPKTNNGVCVGSACGDAGNNGVSDAANNGGADADEGDAQTGSCAPGCPDDLVCNSATNTCVQCVTNTECGENGLCDGDTNTCACQAGFHSCNGACVPETSPDACGEACEVCPDDPNGTRVCEQGSCALLCDAPRQFDPASGSCVECLGNDSCTEPSASTCAAGVCSACEQNADCAHLDGRPTCDSGNCVECTAADESACGDNSCDPLSGTCTTTARASVAACAPCVADSECEPSHACVPMLFGSDLRSGGFCLPVKGAGCVGLYGTEVARTSLSGVARDICTINEALTTCEAINDYNSFCGDASECGATGLDDGLCEPIDFESARCTFLCDATSECPSSSLIGCAPGNGSEKWCGAY